MDKKSVLVIGRQVSDFLCPLFKEMNERYPFEIHLLELRPVSKRQHLIDDSFVSRIDIKTDLESYSIRDFVSSIFKRCFWTSLLSSKNIKESIRDAVIMTITKKKFKNFDIFNIQFLTYDALYFIKFIPNNKKIILSYWGSDLFQCNEVFSYDLQLNAIRRAEKIIMHTPEMKNIFLSKFGRNLENKVEVFLSASISPSIEAIIKHLDKKPLLSEKYRNKHQISRDTIIITIGHSGHDIDDHLNIINTLNSLQDTVKRRCFFILPMTYGSEPGYIDKVEQACIAAGLEFQILKNFIPDDEMMELRFASEIMIRLSKFDAFSLSVCEAICAESIVIAGTWLPYGGLRAANVYFKEIDSFNRLNMVLEDVVLNKQIYLEKCVNNGNKIHSFFKSQNSPENHFKIFSS